MRKLLLMAALAYSLRAQPDPADLLLRVRDKVTQTLDRLPRYLCTQTVDRTQYEPYEPAAVANCDECGAVTEPHGIYGN